MFFGDLCLLFARMNGLCTLFRVCCLQNEWVLYFVSVEREWRDFFFWRFVFVVCKNEWVVYFVSCLLFAE